MVPWFILINNEGQEILRQSGRPPRLEKIIDLMDLQLTN
mgnify:CR=1 FL=1